MRANIDSMNLSLTTGPTRSAFIPAGLLLPVVIALTLIAYSSSLRGGFLWDDDEYVVDNIQLRSADGLRRIWLEPGSTPQYYPMVFTSFWLEYQAAGGNNPTVHRVTNALLHAVNAFLLFLLLRRLNVTGAVWAALVFALHPVQVESVAWIFERKNVLSAFFGLLSALAYFRYRPPDDDGFAPARQRPGWYLASFVLFVCALMSKTVLCSLPVVILLIQWWKQGRLDRRHITPLLPFFVIGLMFGLITVWMEKNLVMAQGADWELSWLQRGLIAARAWCFYAGKLIWPAQLSFSYERWVVDAGAPWQYAFVLVAIGCLAGAWAMRKSWGSGWLTALLINMVVLFPALGFFDVYPFRFSFVADHFQYLASASLIAVIVAGLSRLLAYREIVPARVRTGLWCGLMVILAALTWNQARVYQDVETLWRDTLKKNPSSWLAWSNLGSELMRQGKMEDAEHHFRRALALRQDLANAHLALGIMRAGEQRTREAIEEIERAVGLLAPMRGSLKPRWAVWYADAHYRLAVLYTGAAQYEAAQRHYMVATGINPHRATILLDAGNLAAFRSQWNLALTYFEMAMRLQPDDPDIPHRMAQVWYFKKDTPRAVPYLRQAIGRNPSHAASQRLLAWILATDPSSSVRNGAEALRLAQAVRKQTGDADPLVWDALAAAHAELGRYDDAVRIASRAVDVCQAQGGARLCEAIQSRRDLYASGQPYRAAP